MSVLDLILIISPISYIKAYTTHYNINKTFKRKENENIAPSPRPASCCVRLAEAVGWAIGGWYAGGGPGAAAGEVSPKSIRAPVWALSWGGGPILACR